MSGISTIRGGGIACKIKNIVKETYNEIDYTILTTLEEVDSPDVKSFKDLGVDVNGIKLSHNPLLDCFRFFKLASKKTCDIIHFHELPLAWDISFGISECLCLLKQNFMKASLIYEHQIATAGNLHPLHMAWQHTLFKTLFPLWDKVIVNSKYMLAEVLGLIQPKAEKIEFVPLGVNFEEIQSSIPMNIEGISLLFTGHLSRIKGVDILIKAFQDVSLHNRDVHLHIVGDGELRGFCEEFVKSKNLSDRVHFWGPQPQPILFRLVKGADICVFPSRNDAGGLAALEAMAAGKPIIATRVGGIPEYLKDGRNGILVEPEPHQLARAIEFLLDNEDLRQKIGRTNSQDAKAYSWKKASQEYVRIYESLVR